MFGRTDKFHLAQPPMGEKREYSHFSYVPLDLITWLALGIVTLDVPVGGIVQFMIRVLYPLHTPSGLTTIILIVLFLGGVQLLCLSIIGSYIAHIYDEVKRRPAFIVESILNDPSPWMIRVLPCPCGKLPDGFSSREAAGLSA